MADRPLIVVESPFKAGQGYELSENKAFAATHCRRLVLSGYNVFASHLFYPQFLRDNVEGERARGMQLGYEIGKNAQEVHFYLRRDYPRVKDEDFSRGMAWALVRYEKLGKHIKIIRCHPDGEIIELEEEINGED